MKKSIVLLLLLSACAGGGHLENPKVTTKAQLDADMAACNYEVDKATASSSLDNPFITGTLSGRLYNSCMAQRGYRMVP